MGPNIAGIPRHRHGHRHGEDRREDVAVGVRVGGVECELVGYKLAAHAYRVR